LDRAKIFGVQWTLPQSTAAQLFSAWQDWAPKAPATITSIMKVAPAGNGMIMMRCIGQSVGTVAELRAELRPIVGLAPPSKLLNIQTLSFLDAVLNFAGPLAYASVYMKAKSDYVLTPLSGAAIANLLASVAGVPKGGIVLLCDSYGGQISTVTADASAFPRRRGTLYCIQYFSSWIHPADTPGHIARVGGVYDAMRAYMPGASYVNYCDLDLQNWGHAYWDLNFDRLKQVKKRYDPTNVFHHAQSVPVGP
jgi:hypothetical protein